MVSKGDAVTILNARQLRLAAPYAAAPTIDAIVSRADSVFQKHGLTSLPRVWGFLSVVLEETGGLHTLFELMNYTAERAHEVFPSIFPTVESAVPYAHSPEAFANKVYGGRMGNAAVGDGWRYRGQGLIQITGHDNFAVLERLTGLPLLRHPELVTSPEHMLECAVALFVRYPGILEYCDASHWHAVWALVGTGRANGRIINLPAHEAALDRVKGAITSLGPAEAGSPAASSARVAPPASATQNAATQSRPFSEKIVATASEEWQYFDRQTYDISGHLTHRGKLEGEDPYYKRIGEYWIEGTQTHGIDGRDHGMPWSAAFISWVMKKAGAGAAFRYSTQHSVYISQAIRDCLNGRAAGFWGRRLEEYAPKIGDLVCWARQDGIDYGHQASGNYAGHSDIVVEVHADRVEVIGGNVGDSVTKRPLPLVNGFLQQGRHSGELLFALMENRVATNSAVA